MSKTVKQLTETTSVKTSDILHIVDLPNDQDKKITNANYWGSKPFVEMTLINEPDDIIISVASTAVNIAGGLVLPAAGLINKFTFSQPTGLMTYTGDNDVTGRVIVSTSLSHVAASANKQATLLVYLNGALVTKMQQQGPIISNTDGYNMFCVSGLITLSKDDFLQLFVTNETDTTNLEMRQLNFSFTTL